MCKRDAQFRKAFEDAAEDHAADREAGFRRHSDQPRQPVFRHARLADHVPRMHEDRGVEFLRRLPDHVEPAIIQVPALWSVTMLVRIYMRADLDPA